MQIVDMTKKKFESLKPLNIPNSVFNTEAEMYLFSNKNKWQKQVFVLKKLFYDQGEVFSNKLYTINELLDKKNLISVDELVMPEALAAIDNKIVGFLMPYIPNINFQQILDSKEFTIEEKVAYLKEIGELLEKIRKVREYTTVNDFYLNDIHEDNFILNKETKKINAVDLDSCKIGKNVGGVARYLSPISQISYVPKYVPIPDSIGASYEASEETEIYCYIVIIMKLFYGDNISKMSIGDYFVYLEYLSKLGVPKELLDKLSYIYIGHKNENPYEYLEELIPYYGKSHKNTFEMVRKRKI